LQRASINRRWLKDGRFRGKIDRSPTLEVADAAIRVAQNNAEAATGALFPQVALNSNSSYQISSGDSTTTTVTQQRYSFFTKQVQIGYAPDIWGANRR